ncbi:MAG: N-acetylmuramoyl-L-alanine amidase [Candidatus Omnitrophica bacterium]|nr:N-acetylmuramoyl-L-alanine amidase [Candidatus Omnitrophota bacterium]
MRSVFKSWLIIVSLVLAISAAGCATVPQRGTGGRVADLKKRIYIKDYCDRYAIPWQWDHMLQAVDLKIDATAVRLLVGSDLVLLGKEQVRLNTPAAIDQSSVLVSYDFQTKVMDRFQKRLTEKMPRVSPKPRAKGLVLGEVVIDAGHGGKDPGAIGVTGLQEKTVNLDVARRLKKILEAAGVRVVMTRADDTFISLPERTAIASRSKADLFISVHANSAPSRGVRGVEAYSLRDLGTLEKKEEQRQANQRLLFRNLAMKKDAHGVEDIVSDLLYTHKQSVSPSLAAALAGRTSQLVKTQDLGCKQSRFFVLRNTLVPAVLVETGFLSNVREERLLKSPEYRQKIAEGLAKGILGYGDGK